MRSPICHVIGPQKWDRHNLRVYVIVTRTPDVRRNESPAMQPADPSPREPNPPPDLDLAYYRNAYPDLAGLADWALIRHFLNHGRAEGRIGASAALREHFTKLAAVSGSVLEIGPFCNPCVTGRQVAYFDVLDSDGLRIRAEEIGYPVVTTPAVEFVSPVGDLSIVDRHFDSVISSHCIEHQRDLISHLHQVERILNPGGRYFLLVPDKRFCFDHMIAESNLAEIVAAHRNGQKTHRIESVIEHRALTTHNHPDRHWRGDHADPGWHDSITARARAAISEFDAANGGYIDVHAWQFTPTSLGQNLQLLQRMGLIGLEVEVIFSTPHGRNEFTGILRK